MAPVTKLLITYKHSPKGTRWEARYENGKLAAKGPWRDGNEAHNAPQELIHICWPETKKQR